MSAGQDDVGTSNTDRGGRAAQQWSNCDLKVHFQCVAVSRKQRRRSSEQAVLAHDIRGNCTSTYRLLCTTQGATFLASTKHVADMPRLHLRMTHKSRPHLSSATFASSAGRTHFPFSLFGSGSGMVVCIRALRCNCASLCRHQTSHTSGRPTWFALSAWE